jgi:hypothetical protein
MYLYSTKRTHIYEQWTRTNNLNNINIQYYFKIHNNINFKISMKNKK